MSRPEAEATGRRWCNCFLPGSAGDRANMKGMVTASFLSDQDHSLAFDLCPRILISRPYTAIIQRVLSASVTVDKEVVSSIGKGVLVFAAVAPGDTEKEMNAIAAKVTKMRLWDDEEGGKVSHATHRRACRSASRL